MRFQNTPYWGHFRKPPFSSPFYFTCYCGWYADTHRKVNSFFLLFPLSFPLNIVHVAIFSDVLTKTTETLHTWINQSYSLVEANSRLIGSAGSFLEYISFFRSYWPEFYLKRTEGRKGCTVTLSQTTNNVNSFSLAERILALGSSVIVSMTKMIGLLAKLWPLLKGSFIEQNFLAGWSLNPLQKGRKNLLRQNSLSSAMLHVIRLWERPSFTEQIELKDASNRNKSVLKLCNELRVHNKQPQRKKN